MIDRELCGDPAAERLAMHMNSGEPERVAEIAQMLNIMADFIIMVGLVAIAMADHVERDRAKMRRMGQEVARERLRRLTGPGDEGHRVVGGRAAGLDISGTAR